MLSGAHVLTALAAAAPWAIVPLVILWRLSHSRSLGDVGADVPADAPLVSVVIPARNERANIERCVRSVLAARWPALEVTVVDDHSTDGTAAIARALADGDARLRVIESPPLAPGWFGKQWACATGARASHGAVLAFLDADTVQAPDLIPRAVNALRARDADLLSVAGRQALGSFWERVLQPQVFAMLAARFGGTESVNRSPRVHDKIANGQCMIFRRAAYEEIGGHGAVRHKVAEDLMLAQRMFGAGRRVVLIAGIDQLATRMYASLGEIVRGWRKNIFAGALDATPFGVGAWLVLPLLLVVPPLLELAPPVALLLGLAGLAGATTLLWGAVATAVLLVVWGALYAAIGESPAYALAFPLGAAVLLWIVLGAVARGRRVAWKGREYRAA